MSSNSFPKISSEHRYIRSLILDQKLRKPRTRRNLVHRVSRWWRRAISKGEARRRSANPNERVDRIPLLEGEGFSNLTKRRSSTACVLTRIHCELPFRCRYMGSSSFDLPLSSVPSSRPYLVPFIPYDSFVNLLLRAFAKAGNTARRVLSKLRTHRERVGDLSQLDFRIHTETIVFVW